jgi:hypothetical protein
MASLSLHLTLGKGVVAMLSEIDLKDWIEQPSVPLYDVPRETPIKTHAGLLWFKHIDGMYSLSYDVDGHPVHMKAWATVNPFKKRSDNK